MFPKMGNVQQDIATKMFPPCENNGKRIAYIRQNKTKQNSEFQLWSPYNVSSATANPLCSSVSILS
jgi:hypothetical protein